MLALTTMRIFAAKMISLFGGALEAWHHGNVNRKNPYLFRDTMLKLLHSENLEHKELTKAA